MDNGAVYAIRAAGSHGLFDVVSVYPDGHVHFIQAKLGKPTKDDVRRLVEFRNYSAPENSTVILATPKERKVIG